MIPESVMDVIDELQSDDPQTYRNVAEDLRDLANRLDSFVVELMNEGDEDE